MNISMRHPTARKRVLLVVTDTLAITLMAGSLTAYAKDLPSKEAQAACDQINAALNALPAYKGIVNFDILTNPISKRRQPACHISGEGDIRRLSRNTNLAELLYPGQGVIGQNWRIEPQYSADGPDGTSYVIQLNEVSCLVSTQWTDSIIVAPGKTPSERYQINVACASWW